MSIAILCSGKSVGKWSLFSTCKGLRGEEQKMVTSPAKPSQLGLAEAAYLRMCY